MKQYTIAYWYEYGGTMLWGADEHTKARYGYPIEPEALPISEALVLELRGLEAEWQGSLNWEYPPAPSPWIRRQFEDFYTRARIALSKLQSELGGEYCILDDRLEYVSGS